MGWEANARGSTLCQPQPSSSPAALQPPHVCHDCQLLLRGEIVQARVLAVALRQAVVHRARDSTHGLVTAARVKGCPHPSKLHAAHACCVGTQAQQHGGQRTLFAPPA